MKKRILTKEFQPRMNTNLFLYLDPAVFHSLLPFVNIRVHSWLKFFFLKSTGCSTFLERSLGGFTQSRHFAGQNCFYFAAVNDQSQRPCFSQPVGHPDDLLVVECDDHLLAARIG